MVTTWPTPQWPWLSAKSCVAAVPSPVAPSTMQLPALEHAMLLSADTSVPGSRVLKSIGAVQEPPSCSTTTGSLSPPWTRDPTATQASTAGQEMCVNSTDAHILRPLMAEPAVELPQADNVTAAANDTRTTATALNLPFVISTTDLA